MDTEYYIKKVNDHVSNENIYLPLESDPTDEYQSIFQKIIDHALEMKWINPKTHKFFSMKFPRRPQLYMLPKMHKDPINPPFRPIVSACGSISEPIGKFVDTFLQPIVQKNKTYIKDTTAFLNLLKSVKLEEKTTYWLCTIDVTALYTSIPHNEGIEALEWSLLNSDLEETQRIFIMELMHFALYFSYFEWQKRFFNQCNGTSMGFGGAPSYANIFMCKFETDHILENPRWTEGLIMFKRFIDDIFLIWKGSRQKLEENIKLLNTVNERIKFTFNIDKEAIAFLDVQVLMKNNVIITIVYTKQTDRNSSLLFQSFHPEPLKKHLPTSHFIRLKRITTYNSDLEDSLKVQTVKYRQRGYPQDILESSLKKVAQQPREVLLKEKEKATTQDSKTVCVLKYSTESSRIKRIINKHWPLIQTEPDLNGLYNDKITFAFQRSRNLKEFLNAPKNKDTKWRGMLKCQNCKHCSNVITGNNLTHPTKGYQIELRHTSTCDTTNCIYMIKCPCGKVYVGQTERKIKVRITEHKSNIRLANMKSTVASHWKDAKHQISQLRFMILETISQSRDRDPVKQRLRAEYFWIKTLNSTFPTGLNDRIEYSCFL
ncbi:uncharacterized protein LOC144799740 [Lissotriton helveticus]